jgi:hypothetical protein
MMKRRLFVLCFTTHFEGRVVNAAAQQKVTDYLAVVLDLERRIFKMTIFRQLDLETAEQRGTH